MDEITIGDKTYISSKQAAKITGYAKDYVGQLCREGRVEARLVGRNWYVLDSAIREHRFGKEDEKPAAPAPEAVVDRVSTWQKPQYMAETPILVPDLAERTQETIGSPAIADMQSAWREWFEEKKVTQTALPDGSEDFKDEYLPVVLPEAEAEQPEQKAEEGEKVVISRIRQESVVAPIDENVAEVGERVELHRSYTTTSTPRKEYDDVTAVEQKVPRVVVKRAPVAAKEKGTSSGVVRALLIVVSLAAAVTALIGTGNAEHLLSGTSLDYGMQKEVVDFLGGKSTYKSSL